MGFEHSMNAEIDFKPGVLLEEVFSALLPLSKRRGWKSEELLANNLRYEDEVEITVENGVVERLSIYTGGEVSHSFPVTVNAFAEGLAAIAEPGCILLRDHDTGDLENAIDSIWYGLPAEVEAAQRVAAWKKVKEMLQDISTPDAVIAEMAAVGGFDPS
jgi:hypothetical protein